jgi:predicted ATPase
VFFGHRCLGISLFYFGQFVEARLHLERAFGLLDSEQQKLLIERYGLDQQVGALRSPLPLLPVTLYLLGYPSQAAALAQQELAAAEHEPHPFALGHALYHAAWHAQLRRDRHGAKEHTAKLASLALDQSFAFWLGAATVLHGWALGNEKPVHEGIAEITRGIALFCSTGAELWMPYYLALLAETEGRGSKSTEGLRLLAEALGRVESTSEDWIEPELHRLKGEILLRQPAAEAASEAEACFRRSLDIARKQSAKSWELRAATSLARLWRDRGRRAEAYDLLAPVYGWFTEGFDTADLQDAKALLDALA